MAGGKTSADGVFTVVRAYLYFQSDNEWVQAGEDISDFAYASAASGTDHAALQTILVSRTTASRSRSARLFQQNDDDEVSAGRDEGVPVRAEDVGPDGIGFIRHQRRGPSRVGGGRFRRRRARGDRLARLEMNEGSLGRVAVYQWNEADETWDRWVRLSKVSGGMIAWEAPCPCPPTA